MKTISPQDAPLVRCEAHPGAEVFEDAKADTTSGIGGAWVHLFCEECGLIYFSDAIARYYLMPGALS